MSDANDAPRLRAGDAAAALIIRDDGRYVLQLRDDLPHIWYPGHWGCFGGAVDPGESAVEALRRELYEELALEVSEPRYLTGFVFDLTTFGLAAYRRDYYVVQISSDSFARCRLGEGAAFGAFSSAEALGELRLVPYDAFALFLHSERHRIG